MDQLDVYVEVRPDPSNAGNLVGQTTVEKFRERVHELGASLGDIANQLRDQLEHQLRDHDETGWQLEEIGLTFSLDLEAEAGVVVARAATTAGFEASLSWKRKRAASDGSIRTNADNAELAAHFRAPAVVA